MISIDVNTASGGYPVYIGENLISSTVLWQRHLQRRPAFIVSNEVVAPHYLQHLLQALDGEPCGQLILPDGEQHKTTGIWRLIIDRLVQANATRDTVIIALGGGVIGDLAGFAASTYMRGIDVIQVPTTLLAQVDASVGGKTAVNHQAGKNLIGAFHQPTAVIADINTLNTLNEREYGAGLAEVVKYGAIRDAAFFDWLDNNAKLLGSRIPDAVLQAVKASVEHKAAVVAADEKEKGQRALLNFGHSFAHALETITRYQSLLHGEAVSIGMVAAARLSRQLGLCDQHAEKRLIRLLSGLGLPVAIPAEIDRQDIVSAMRLDKKNLDQVRRLILLRGIGDAFIAENIREADITTALKAPEAA